MPVSSKSVLVATLLGVAGVSTAGATGLQKSAEGLQQIGQGIQQIGQGAKNAVETKTQKFVDVAGNVYDVLTDSLGQATKFVVDSTGAILDSTKIAGGFFMDSLLSYPGDVKEGLEESRESAREYMAAGRQAAQQFGQIAMDARPELPPFKQMLNPGAWKDAAKQSGQKLTNSFGQMENQLMEVYDDIEAEFCTPAMFTPHMKMPTEITMPGFYLEVGLGSCNGTHSEEPLTEFDHTDAFNCTKPYAEVVHTPGKFVAKHHKPIEFTSKECKKETVFGEDEVIVLFEFNGHDALDLERVRGTISNALGGLQNGVGALTGQVEQFVSGLKEVPASIQEKLSGLGKFGTIPAAY